METESAYVTVPYVAADLGVERRTVIRAIRRGALEATKTHPGQQGRWRILATSYRKYKTSEQRAAN
ncbi:helix-turn-helix domain-containing protein [Streptosporangium sp. NPDC051022]|uniref:helix-turn-helix domain-containing protein n=1 Tax=Streptosporangium sp. NPDC051022 TaxID=3155752 RepID=UPI003419A8A8